MTSYVAEIKVKIVKSISLTTAVLPTHGFCLKTAVLKSEIKLLLQNTSQIFYQMHCEGHISYCLYIVISFYLHQLACEPFLNQSLISFSYPVLVQLHDNTDYLGPGSVC